MSQLLNRVVKPFICKHQIRDNNNNKKKIVRWCSSMTMLTYSPMLLDYILKLADSRKDSSDGRIAIERGSYCSAQRHIVIKDKKLEKEVRNAMTLRYDNNELQVSFLRKPSETLRLEFFYEPTDPLSEPVVISPHLPKGSLIQNIAMSSYSDLAKEDFAVAIKLFGSQIKLSRPASACPEESRWINVKAMPRSINPLSSLMYSKKDQRFYDLTPGADFLYSLDPKSKENDNPEFIALCTEDFPKQLDQDELDELNSFIKTVHFVEAPSGEQFLVKWFFMEEIGMYKGLSQVTNKTTQFMVFRSEDNAQQKNIKRFFYTEDIGDLCIFLGHRKPFCVPASSHLGLRPNCIYFVGYNVGIYDIASQNCNLFYAGEDIFRSIKLPYSYWPHP